MDEEIKISEEFILPRDLSAMAKTFFVQTEKPLHDDEWFIKKGSTVTGVKVIAAGEKIRDVQRLIRENLLQNGEKTKAQDWYKCRGTAIITNGKEEKIAEVHWYQCENIGKIEFKEKPRSDGNAAKV
ncbi:MAG: hypothetical protein IKO05_07680 [Selenomonadaceae bacterium]|nr:hypothetical protein [Selenomonadaceae bacterium]